MNVVSNASPLISLARVGHLHLLHQIYNNVVIPEAVWYEVVIQGKGQVGADDVQTATWIQRQAVTNRLLTRTLQRDLDVGEAEAIVLALETRADALIIDERLGRETAAYLGVRCTGVLGVLIAAKNRGHIQSIKPLLDALRAVAGFRVSDTLYHNVLHDVGEV
jgi:uncharacterized protein